MDVTPNPASGTVMPRPPVPCPVTVAAHRERLIEITRALLAELRHETGALADVTMDSALDSDLALDSLARMELFLRVEREFDVRLPQRLFETAQRLADLATAIEGTHEPARHARPLAVHDARRSGTDILAPPTRISLDRVLSWHAERHPDFRQLIILDEDQEETLSYGRLWLDARAIAFGLQNEGIGAGARVALMLPTGRDYFSMFFGILLAGAVPVPLYPPARPTQVQDHLRRHAGILENAGAHMLVTTRPLRNLARVVRALAPCLRGIVTAEELRSTAGAPAPVAVDPGATAMLQYTSGSTGQPKGVALTHTNILANIAALGTALRLRSDDVFVSWLPLYHDMGLIGAWLGTLYFGLPLVVMSPMSFLSNPLRWLEALHRYRGTLSAAPNFAYELCLKHVTGEDLAALDLSHWRIAMNGAEPVMPDTLLEFQARFSRCGFAETAMTPVYGLAECSVGLTVPPLDRGPLIDVIQREPFMRERIAMPAEAATSAAPMRFASCGRPIPGHQIRIVDDQGVGLPERREGRIEFRGPSATRGYFDNPAATSALVHDGWLDTGDRGYIACGELYVTGRIKDIVIRAGRHIHPEELEAAIGDVAGVRKGCVAVIGSTDRQQGTERLVVVAETRLAEPPALTALKQKIVATVLERLGEPADEVILAPPHTVLKTSSGKIRRAATREWYETGRHAAIGRFQQLRLGTVALVEGLRRTARHSLDTLYGIYCWIVFIPLGAAAALLLMAPFTPLRRWRVVHATARLLIRATGMTVQIEGRQHLASPEPRIIVVNHGSYLDALLLAYALPRPCTFVAKQELARIPLVAGLLRRLDTQFVDRFDLHTVTRDLQQVAQAISERSCIFFPEGTFTRHPGLRPFHLGAFTTAVAVRRAVLPVALNGVRRLLPDGAWLPRRARISISISAPVRAPDNMDAFRAALSLRDAAWAWIGDHCGEAGAPAAHADRNDAADRLRSTSDSNH